MVIKLQCSCGKKFKVPDEHAGKKIQCKTCGKKLLVPVPSHMKTYVQEEAAEGAERAQLLKHQAEGFQWGWITAGMLVMVGFTVLIGEIFLSAALLSPEVRTRLLELPQDQNFLYYQIGALGFIFLFSGMFIGRNSPGKTILEPALSAILFIALQAAFAGVLVYAMGAQMGAGEGSGSLEGLKALWDGLPQEVKLKAAGGTGIAALFALIGGWIGEKIQGN